MSTADAPIVIAGAGIGGLAAALALSRCGFNVEIFERRSDPDETGAGIQVGPNGIKVLRALGVAPDLAAVAHVPDAIVPRLGEDGRALPELPLGRWIENRHGAPYWTLRRRDLHRVLRTAIDAAASVKVTTGVGVEGFASGGPGGDVAIALSDAQTHTAALLIAADGQSSRLRAQIVPQHPVGGGTAYSASRTTIPIDAAGDNKQARTSVGVWFSPHGHLVHYPVNAGRELNVVLISRRIDETAASRSVLDNAARDGVIADLLAVAPSLAAGTVDALRSATWGRWQMEHVPPLGSWTSAGAALLGDAAHPIAPFLAQGAVMALEDAIVLATELARARCDVRPLQEGLAAYENARRSRVEKVRLQARNNGRIYHMRGNLGRVRNVGMRLAGGPRLMASYDWLYGWDPPLLDTASL
ncbi:MAG: FAD-dependent monooxygenase [Pseudomonadota bacterium]